MLVDFEALPDESRVWIYQSNRSFTEAEITEIKEGLAQFLTQWTAHGSELKAGFTIKYKRFIVIALDQSLAGASGCSID
ncbi:MAG: ABC transporter ATPase, partial [Bacteroidota bacterium]